MKVLFYLAVIIFFLIPYSLDFWWKFILASALICGITISEKSDWKFFLGLNANKSQFFIAALLLLLLSLLFKYFLFDNIIKYNHIKFIYYPYLWFLSISFQVFNEEIILRSVLIREFLTFTKNKIFISSVISMIFVILHFLFYFYAQNDILNNQSLITLFSFGFICNLLYLIYNHIWYGYAIHLAWNLNQFSRDYFYNGKKLSEGFMFNLIEGNIAVVTISITTAILITIIVFTRNRRLIF